MELTIFRDYFREEREELHKDCFEYDWFNCKQLKYKKCSEEEVKSVMKSAYKLIKEFYKLHAGYGRIGNIFSVGLNQFTEFLKEDLNILDTLALTMSDADRLFITVNAGKRGPLIPANALVRFQFVEMILRIALRRYYESQEAPTEAEALQMLIERNLIPAK